MRQLYMIRDVIVPLLLMVMLVLLIGGCASSAKLEREKAYYEAQAAAQQNEQPLVRMRASDPEKGIFLAGVSEFSVYAPRNNVIRALPQDAPHPIWRVVEVLTMGAIQYGGIRESRRTAVGIAQAIGGTDRADQSSTTTVTVGGNMGDTDQSTWSNTGRIDSPDAWSNTGRVDSPSSIDSRTTDNRVGPVDNSVYNPLPEPE